MATPDDLMTQILMRVPSPGTLHVVLSRIKEEGDMKRAIQECLKALSVYPDDIPIRKLLAESYVDSGLLAQAESELEKISSLMEHLLPMYKLQAEVYMRQGRKQEAVRVLRIYLAHHPEDRNSFDLLEELEPKGVEAVEKDMLPHSGVPAQARIPEDLPLKEPQEAFPEIWTPEIAEIYAEQGLLREAISTYENILREKPDDERSRQRMLKFRGMLEESIVAQRDLALRKKKENLIAVLEEWLSNIKVLTGGNTNP